MSEQERNCWVCGNKANSREHKIKKSDLKTQYPKVSQRLPLYHRVNGVIKRPIGSTNADAFKYPKSICAICNGALTQPHDGSWEKLSEFMSNHSTEIKNRKTIDLTTVFERDLNINLINIQLFFAKQFGCKIVESDFEFDLTEIGKSIRLNKEVQSLYIKLRCSDNGKSESYTANSDIEVKRLKNGALGYIHFFYTFGAFTVDILHSTVPKELDLTNYFLPCTVVNKLYLGTVNYSQNYVES